MSFYDMLKSLVDKVVLPRKARKEARRVGDIMQDALRFGKNKRGRGLFVLQVQTRDCPKKF